jgi:hypothetical protein
VERELRNRPAYGSFMPVPLYVLFVVFVNVVGGFKYMGLAANQNYECGYDKDLFYTDLNYPQTIDTQRCPYFSSPPDMSTFHEGRMRQRSD